MTKIYLLLFLLATIQSFGQNTIKGKVIDTSESVSLQHAVISVIRVSDSVLLKFTRSAADGSFEITGIPRAKAFVMVTYPGYADFVDEIRDTTQPLTNMGTVALIRKS
jgi:hypothetical protein